MAHLVSPNEMHQAACDQMLEGRQPVTEEDWVKVVNFYAANVAAEVQPTGVTFMAMIMGCPLPSEYVERISAFQVEQMAKRN
jgi:hypothetical protein